MRLEIDIPKHQYNNIMEIDSINLGRVPYKGIIMYAINAIKRGKALEQEPTTKNDLGVDYISRTRAIERLKLNFPISDGADNSRDRHRYMQALADIQAIRELPSVTPRKPQTFKWCTDCREYDQEKHCCPRWSKVIRDTVEEMKQEYIEREVLDKLKAEITTLQNRCYALTKGTMCSFCKYECEYKAETENP